MTVLPPSNSASPALRILDMSEQSGMFRSLLNGT